MASTDALIESLTAEVAPVRHRALPLRLAAGLTMGGAVTLALVLLVLGPRPDLIAALHGMSIWMKWGYTLALAAVAVAMAAVLARPERRDPRWLWFAAVPVVAIAALAARELTATAASDVPALWLGHSWRACPVRVLLLSVPLFAGLLWAFRAFAPTRLRLTGAVAGFAAGACAATLYGLACDETSALFLLTWYSLAIAAATGLGALLGPRMLRW